MIDSRIMQMHWDVDVIRQNQLINDVSQTYDEALGDFVGLGKRKRNDELSLDDL